MPNQPILNTPSPATYKLEALRQLFPQAVETDADGRIRVNAAQLQLALAPANPAGIRVEEDGFELRWVGTPAGKYNPDFGYAIHQSGAAQALYLVVETKGYDSLDEVSDREKWKILSARHFFKTLQEKGLPLHYKTKINGEQLAQLIHQIDPSVSQQLP